MQSSRPEFKPPRIAALMALPRRGGAPGMVAARRDYLRAGPAYQRQDAACGEDVADEAYQGCLYVRGGEKVLEAAT